MKPVAIVVTHIPNQAITDGFIPAAQKLGYELILITDHGLDHHSHFAQHPPVAPFRIIECDVFNPLAIIDTILNNDLQPQLVFSNSDHLQTSNAIVASYFNLPTKQWQRCYQAKNKYEMRKRLNALQLPSIWSTTLTSGSEQPDAIPYPVVAKPREGVASLDVTLCHSAKELEAYCQAFWQAQPCSPVLIEEFMDGELFTLETLSDGKDLVAIGGFDVSLSEPPYFIETEAVWNGPNSQQYLDQALEQLKAFGIGFGVCHSEFIVTAKGPVLVEINYRSIGDGREFLLDELLPYSWFETILSLHAGQPLPDLSNEQGCAHIRYFPATKPGMVTAAPEAFQYQQNGVSLRHRTLKQVGDNVVLTHSNKDYLSVLTLVSKHPQPLAPALTQATESLIWEIKA